MNNGTLFASYTYPTRGDEVMQLAIKILTGKKYNRETQLSSALVTRNNARVLLMQYDETVRQQDHLSTLRSRVDKAANDFNTQRIYLLVLLVFVVLLIVMCAAAVYAFFTRTRINRQLKASMDEQRRMTAEMEEMTQTQLQFFTNMSHELRTPLTLIAGPAEQLLEDPTIKGGQRSMLEMVQRNTRILIQLVGEILDFRKVQNNKAELHLNRFYLQQELTTWTEDFRTVAARRGITIHVDVSGVENDAMLIADRNKMEHVYFNIMSNALKYTPEKGSISISLIHSDHSYTLRIADTGKGIPAEELPHLFERFYQAKGAIGGTGIGLSLVKAYIDMHHGDVHAESEDGKGTTFVIKLPDSQPGYDPAKDAPAATQAEKGLVDDNYIATDSTPKENSNRITNAEDFDAERPLVLIIDDNNGMRAYLRSILQDKYNVSEATNGEQGLEKARPRGAETGGVRRDDAGDERLGIHKTTEGGHRNEPYSGGAAHGTLALRTAQGGLRHGRRLVYHEAVLGSGAALAHRKPDAVARIAAVGVRRRQAGGGGRRKTERSRQVVRGQTALGYSGESRRQRLLGGADWAKR